MNENRRNFMKGTGAACALAVTGRLPEALGEPQRAATESRGMARALTLLNIRRGTDRKGVSFLMSA